ncbi:MAG: hypothetical protein EWV82_11865 [Microcystis aeruginosa Ma_AC_P_19900807_S299]|nr:MAG: hypothetical protein EWV82_11865 [Microcystis aeruginosa Ma_AC_P_19900807_S299]
MGHLKTGKTPHPTPHTPHPAPRKNFLPQTLSIVSDCGSHLNSEVLIFRFGGPVVTIRSSIAN